MAILNSVKQALGVYYSELSKDEELNDIIRGAKSFLEAGGWPSDDLQQDSESPLAVQAIIIYAKMAMNTDPTEMRMNPILVSLIAQARLAREDE